MTIKELLRKYMDGKSKYRYIDALPDIVENYNNSPHRVIDGMAPTAWLVNNIKCWDNQPVYESLEAIDPGIRVILFTKR